MRITFLMHEVQTIHHLMEIRPGNFFREFARFSNEVKELSSSNVLQNYCEAIICWLVSFFVSGILSDTDEFD